MSKIVRLTEADLMKLVKRVIKEQKNVKPVLCSKLNPSIKDHMWCNEISKGRIYEIECGALGLTDPNTKGKFGGHKVVKGMCNGKDGKPIKTSITEQKKITPDPEAVKSVNELIKNVQTGFCIPVYDGGSRTRLDCKDGKYHEIRHFRPFGQY